MNAISKIYTLAADDGNVPLRYRGNNNKLIINDNKTRP